MVSIETISTASSGIPSDGRSRCRGFALELDVTTPLVSQELFSNIGPSYWEGAIDISGRRGSEAVRGTGYLEMTGYSATPGMNSML